MLDRAASGDQTAFAAFYDATSAAVYGLAVSFISDHSKAEDVTHEIYIDAWVSAPTFRLSSQNPRAWLEAIARHKIALSIASG